MGGKDRIAGLDLVRVCAISLVVLYHTPIANNRIVLGWLGVDLFFVLSGYLIGQMLIERFDAVRSRQALGQFLLNRWLRTLPLYYLFLAIHVLLVLAHPIVNPSGGTLHYSLAQIPDLMPFLTFTQNLTQGGAASYNNWFGVSWTLATEEWFYLLLPLVLWGLRRQPPENVILGLTLVLVAVAVGARAMRYVDDSGNLDFDDMYRRVALFRLDTFCFGVLAYLFVRRYPASAQRCKLAFFAGGLALVALPFTIFGHSDFAHAYLKVLSLTIVPAGMALMLPLFAGLAISSERIRAGLRFVSTRTYAIYLSNFALALLYEVWVGPLTLVTLPLFAVILLASADLIYRTIERPFLKLRPTSATGPALRLPTARPSVNWSQNPLTGSDPNAHQVL